MLNKYRLFQRVNGVFYCQDNESGKQSSLRTKDRRAAEKLLHAQNEAHRLPTLNLTMARAYLSARDPKMSTRTWAAVMREMATHGIASSRNAAREPSARKRSIRSATNPSSRQPQRICSRSCTTTDTQSPTISVVCTIWRVIWAGWLGQSLPSGSGQRCAASAAAP